MAFVIKSKHNLINKNIDPSIDYNEKTIPARNF